LPSGFSSRLCGRKRREPGIPESDHHLILFIPKLSRMLPTKLNHPHFVPDQLLSADHLNQVFEFLDEQGRMTRTNLIGMGIVCGLEPSLSADGTENTLSAGVGITSHGHLISMPQRTLSRRKDYPVNREYVYGP